MIYAAPALIYILVLLVLIGLLGVFGFLSNSDGAFIINATRYLLIAVTAGLIQGGTFNYVAQNLTMEGVRFSSTLNKGEFAWLYFTNLLAVVGTLGLALPWAIVRAHAYKVSHFYVHIDDPRVMDRIRSAAQREGSGVGDAATDLMDIEVGI